MFVYTVVKVKYNINGWLTLIIIIDVLGRYVTNTTTRRGGAGGETCITCLYFYGFDSLASNVKFEKISIK